MILEIPSNPTFLGFYDNSHEQNSGSHPSTFGQNLYPLQFFTQDLICTSSQAEFLHFPDTQLSPAASSLLLFTFPSSEMKRSDRVTAARRHHEVLPHRLLAELLRQHAAVLSLARLHQLLLGCDLLNPLDQGAVALPVITQHLLDALQLRVAERKNHDRVRGEG